MAVVLFSAGIAKAAGKVPDPINPLALLNLLPVLLLLFIFGWSLAICRASSTCCFRMRAHGRDLIADSVLLTPIFYDRRCCGSGTWLDYFHESLGGDAGTVAGKPILEAGSPRWQAYTLGC